MRHNYNATALLHTQWDLLLHTPDCDIWFPEILNTLLGVTPPRGNIGHDVKAGVIDDVVRVDVSHCDRHLAPVSVCKIDTGTNTSLYEIIVFCIVLHNFKTQYLITSRRWNKKILQTDMSSRSIVCMGQQQTRFYWSCFSRYWKRLLGQEANKTPER